MSLRQIQVEIMRMCIISQLFTFTGTPICEMFSPFGKLPKYDNFGKDMTEHIAFENLPNYTGNWDKMRGVLKGVRGKKTE